MARFVLLLSAFLGSIGIVFSDCPGKKIANCLLKLKGATTREGFTPEVLLESCDMYGDVRRCLSQYTGQCTYKELLSVRMTEGFMDFLCTPLNERVLHQALSCVKGQIYEDLLGKCEIPQMGKSCRNAKEAMKCATDMVGKACEQRDIATLYHNIIATLVKVSHREIFHKPCAVSLLKMDATVLVKTAVIMTSTTGHHSSHITALPPVKGSTLPQIPDVSDERPVVSAVRPVPILKAVPHIGSPLPDKQTVYSHASYETGYIMGVCLGVALLVGAVVAVVVVYLRRRHRRTRESLVNNEYFERM